MHPELALLTETSWHTVPSSDIFDRDRDLESVATPLDRSEFEPEGAREQEVASRSCAQRYTGWIEQALVRERFVEVVAQWDIDAREVVRVEGRVSLRSDGHTPLR
jgi:hypothetical protein